MEQRGNSENRFSGPYMVQDHDHMAEITPAGDEAKKGPVRQHDQAQEGARQQGASDQSSRGQRGAQRRQAE